MKRIATLLIAAILTISCQSEKSFIIVENSKFIKNGKPYHFVGTNYWYGALLGAKSGNRERLLKELDELKAYGISNLRVLVGAEGGSQDFTVREALQTEQGKYNEELLEGLDFLLSEMKKRDLTAILYLNNNWEWSGGMAKYLECNGYGKGPNPHLKPNTSPHCRPMWPKYPNARCTNQNP